jgi:hypothetical protein
MNAELDSDRCPCWRRLRLSVAHVLCVCVRVSFLVVRVLASMERQCCFRLRVYGTPGVAFVLCLCGCCRVARLSSSSSALRGRAFFGRAFLDRALVTRLFPAPRCANLLEVCVGGGCPVARLSSPSSASRRRQLARTSWVLTPCPAMAVFDAALFSLCAVPCDPIFPAQFAACVSEDLPPPSRCPPHGEWALPLCALRSPPMWGLLLRHLAFAGS